MFFLGFLKALVLGIVEGITEWLPVSSTGHLILVDEFLQLKNTPGVSDGFGSMFDVVIQLGAILSVVVLYFKRLVPLKTGEGGALQMRLDNKKLSMWVKIIVACLPAAIVGLLFDDFFTEHFYNLPCVAAMLIIFGILFIIVENYQKGKKPKINSIAAIDYKTAAIIGAFQLIAAIFPGTSRSGATIVGALLISVSRTAAAEFTFFLAVPVMFGASALKLAKFFAEGNGITGTEIGLLITGMLVAFIVSVFAIKFLMGYIKKHDFKVFGWYRIVLGIIALLVFFIAK